MELRIPAQAAIFFAAALMILTWFFDDPAPGFAALGLLVILISDALLLMYGASNAAGKTTISRHTEERYAQKGTVHQVSVQIDVPVIPGATRHCNELLSPAMELISGTTDAPIPPGAPAVRLQYRWRSFVVGRVRPAGVLLTFKDRFFSFTIPLTNQKAREPSFLIFPSQTTKNPKQFGDRETNKPSLIHGHSVLSFRQFADGDDLSSIDWKLTAKYDKTYIREYSGVYHGEPFLIVDLPETQNGMQELRELILQIIHGISEPGVLLIAAGPNIIRYLRLPLKREEIERLSEDLQPTTRLENLYRFYEPQALWRETQNSNDILQQRIDMIFSGFALHETLPEYGYLLDGLIHMGREQDIVVFTTGQGDQSHIGVAASVASIHHASFRVYLPQQLLTKQKQQRIAREGISMADGIL